MERLRDIAVAHYSAGSLEVKNLAYDFFKALDVDQDGLVSLQEFLALMKQEGHTRLANPYFFRDLDRDRNGFLDFWEVLTLYYIIKCGMPLCECCGILILETFFSCVECFDNPNYGSYSLCIHCYRSNQSSHRHDGRQQFLDTFMLLQTKKTPPRPVQQGQQPSMDELYYAIIPAQSQMQWQQPNTGEQNAIVPARPGTMSTLKAALVALEVGLAIGSISTTLCTIL